MPRLSVTRDHSLEQRERACTCSGLRPNLSSELAENTCDMFLGSGERDDQLPGNLLVGGPLREQVQDLLFALGEWLKELLCRLRRKAWQSFGDRGDDLLLNDLALLACKGGEHCRGIDSKCRWDREVLLLHGFSGEQCLECLVHRLSRIEKDAQVS